MFPLPTLVGGAATSVRGTSSIGCSSGSSGAPRTIPEPRLGIVER